MSLRARRIAGIALQTALQVMATPHHGPHAWRPSVTVSAADFRHPARSLSFYFGMQNKGVDCPVDFASK